MTCPVPWHTRMSSPVASQAAATLVKHPRCWSKEDVVVWLNWCVDEYSIEPMNSDVFDFNGKALCLLSRDDFIERLPKNGDLLYNSLQAFVSKGTGKSNVNPYATRGYYCKHSANSVEPDQTASNSPSDQGSPAVVQPQMAYPVALTDTQVVYRDVHSTNPSVQTDPLTPSLLLVPSSQAAGSVFSTTTTSHGLPKRGYVPIRPRPGFSPTTGSLNTSPSRTPTPQRNQDTVHVGSELPSQGRNSIHLANDCRLLWEFIYQLLLNANYSGVVSWENKAEYVFRIVNPTGLAELWGQQKNRTNMTYEKLSRALRYYYRMNIIKKVPGKRLTYRFMQVPSRIQKGQRGVKPQNKYSTSFAQAAESSVTKVDTDEEVFESVGESDDDIDLERQSDEERSPLKEEQDNPTSMIPYERLHNSPNMSYDSRSIASGPRYSLFGSSTGGPSGSSLPAVLSNVFRSHNAWPYPPRRSISEFRLSETFQHESKYDRLLNVRDSKQIHSQFGTLPFPKDNLMPFDIKSELSGASYAESTSVCDERLPDRYYRSATREVGTRAGISVLPRASLRPIQARSISPHTDMQREPEDLSVKRETRSGTTTPDRAFSASSHNLPRVPVHNSPPVPMLPPSRGPSVTFNPSASFFSSSDTVQRRNSSPSTNSPKNSSSSESESNVLDSPLVGENGSSNALPVKEGGDYSSSAIFERDITVKSPPISGDE